MEAPAKVELTGVPETALWNLYQRASAARADLHEVPQAGGDRLLSVLRRVPGLKSQLPTVPVFQARLGLAAAW
jgi:hypothetical protein